MSTPSQSPNSPDQRGGSQGHSAWTQKENSAWSQGNSAWRQNTGSWNQTNADTRPGAPSTQPLPQDSTRQASSQEPGRPADTREPSISVQQFAPRRNRLLPILLAVAAVVAFLGLWWLASRPDSDPEEGPAPTPTISRTAPSVPPSGEFANSTPFGSNGMSGTFTVNDSSWDGSTLSVNVTVQLDAGQLKYRFLAMDMASGDIDVMTAGPGSDGLSEGILTEGESITGVIQIVKERGDTQIVLSQTSGDNVTMLAVKG